MKIFHIISGLKAGGAESALYNFLAHLPENGDVHCVAYFHHGHNVRAIQQLGITTFHIKGIVSCYDPLAYFSLKRIIRDQDPDIIHSSLWSANIIGRIIAHQLKLPIICDIHGNPAFEGSFRNWLDKKTAPLSTKIVAVSDGVKQAYVKTIINSVKNQAQRDAIDKRLVVIKNGVNSSLLRQKAAANKLERSELCFDRSDFVIGAVGRLEPIKSYNVLLASVALLKCKYPTAGIKVCIVGDGSARHDLEAFALQYNLLPNIKFMGMRSDPYRFYPLFDCFALSSQSEGLSIALLEALAFGLPVVTTHDAKHHEIITDNVNGYLVPPNNPEDLALALEKLYLHPTTAKQMRLENIKKANESFSLQAVISRYHHLYQEIMHKSF